VASHGSLTFFFFLFISFLSRVDTSRRQILFPDALSEISIALKFEPDCPLIKKKAEEIVADFSDFYKGMVLGIIFQYLKKWRSYE
jgi:hypothetical protein